MFCPICGNYINDNAVFCSNCGQRISSDQKKIEYESSFLSNIKNSVQCNEEMIILKIRSSFLYLFERSEKEIKINKFDIIRIKNSTTANALIVMFIMIGLIWFILSVFIFILGSALFNVLMDFHHYSFNYSFKDDFIFQVLVCVINVYLVMILDFVVLNFISDKILHNSISIQTDKKNYSIKVNLFNEKKCNEIYEYLLVNCKNIKY